MQEERPFVFVENMGQLDERVRFHVVEDNWSAFIVDDGFDVVFSAPGLGSVAQPCADAHAPLPNRSRVALQFRVDGGSKVARNRGCQAKGSAASATLHSFFRGADPKRWVANAPAYAQVRFDEIFPGIDLELYAKHGCLEYDLIFIPESVVDAFGAPGLGMPSIESNAGESKTGESRTDESLSFRVDGAQSLSIDAEGALLCVTEIGVLRQAAPLILYECETGIASAFGSFQLLGPQRFGFRLPELPGRRPGSVVRLDPQLAWSTYLGGSQLEEAYGVAVDQSGSAIVTGFTSSLDFPNTAGVISGRGDTDMFLTRLAADGASVLWSVVLGGTFSIHPVDGSLLPGNDLGADVSVDANGLITVIGWTSSEDFPTTSGCFDSSYNGGVEFNELGDSFLVQLDPSAIGQAQLVYSTYFGGNLIDNTFGHIVEANGNVTIMGHTHSVDFPITPNAYQAAINDPVPGDAFVSRFAPEGNGAADLLWSTFLGGSGFDYAYGMVLDAAGRPILVGQAGDVADFPTTPGAYDRTHNGSSDGFVACLDPTLSAAAQLVYSSYLGGSKGDTIYDAALREDGSIVLVGYSSSADLPVGPSGMVHRETYAGGFSDVFVAAFDPRGNAGQDLAWCTYVGGSRSERSQRVRLDAAGAMTVVGFTNSTDFPQTPGQIGQGFAGAGEDGFVFRLSPSGDSLRYSSLLGGAGSDRAYGLALDSVGTAVVVGSTLSVDLPTSLGSLSTSLNGASDGFVMRLCPEECLASADTQVIRPGRAGLLGVPQLTSSSSPQLGTADFAWLLTGASANSMGVLEIKLEPTPGLAARLSGRSSLLTSSLVPFQTDLQGMAQLEWPLACDVAFCGSSFRIRALIQDPSAPAGLAVSQTLRVVLGF